MGFHRMLEWFSRVVFCTPIPEEFTTAERTRPQRALYQFAFVFDCVDLLDSLLDIIMGIRLCRNGMPVPGFLLLFGIFLARSIAHKGKYVLLQGGLCWVPFFQDPHDFMDHLPVDRQATLRALYAILFTEIAIFMFEDATILHIWIFNPSVFDKTDILDQFNAWVTLLSTSMGALILLAAVFASLRNWRWKTGILPKLGQIASALLFVVLFGIIFTYLNSILYFGFQTIATGQSTMEGGLVIAICVSWIFAMFFSCRLRMHAKYPREMIALAEMEGTTNIVYCSTDFPPAVIITNSLTDVVPIPPPAHQDAELASSSDAANQDFPLAISVPIGG